MSGTEMRGITTCAVEVSPDVVYAGTEIAVRVRVSCSPACDLRGHTVFLRDQTGADAGRAEVAAFDGSANEAGEIVVRAPIDAGEYAWTAVCPAVVRDGVAYAEATVPLSLTVTPHATSVVAWDIPSAVEAGDRFRIRIGMKCSQECRLANRQFEVCDQEGTVMAVAILSGDYWPGTSLYVAEVELESPGEEGLYTWSARSPRTAVGTSHAEGAVTFGLRVVNRPDCRVKVEAVDKVSQAPFTGARVVMHPYRAVTDERGVAEVRVSKGAYTLFVSQPSYFTFAQQVEVTADVTIRAELDEEPVLERN